MSGAGTTRNRPQLDASVLGFDMNRRRRAHGKGSSDSDTAWQGILTPAQLTGNQDDWGPPGLAGATVIRASTDASHNLSGIQGGYKGRWLLLVNIGSNPLVLLHNQLSAAANQFFCPALKNLTVFQYQATLLWWDITLNAWLTLPVGPLSNNDVAGYLQFETLAAHPINPTLPQLYNFGGFIYEQFIQGNVPLRIIPGELKASIFVPGQMGRMAPRADNPGAAPFMDFMGLFNPLTETSPTAPTFNLDANGRYINYNTAAAIGSVAGIETANPICRRDKQFISQLKFALPSTANVRMFIGVTDQTLATMVAADQPAGLYMGLQYSTPRGDTTWQHVRKNGAGTFSKSNSTITVDTLFHFARLLGLTGTPFGQLFDAAMAILGSTVTLGSPPVNTSNLKFVAGIESEAAASKSISISYGDIAQDITL